MAWGEKPADTEDEEENAQSNLTADKLAALPILRGSFMADEVYKRVL
jgi:hypothetical protein